MKIGNQAGICVKVVYTAIINSELISDTYFVVFNAGRKPAKVTRLGADPTWKMTWRLIRSWICHNHKIYYSYAITCAFLTYQFWWYNIVGYYRSRNWERSLPYAI